MKNKSSIARWRSAQQYHNVKGIDAQEQAIQRAVTQHRLQAHAPETPAPMDGMGPRHVPSAGRTINTLVVASLLLGSPLAALAAANRGGPLLTPLPTLPGRRNLPNLPASGSAPAPAPVPGLSNDFGGGVGPGGIPPVVRDPEHEPYVEPPLTGPLADAPSPALARPGPYEVAPMGTYNLGWFNDSTVVPNQAFELWGDVHRPLTLTSDHPLVFLVHGMHAVCNNGTGTNFDYVARDTECEPLPNHAGYEYLARDLASHGMVAVSVNMNAINAWTDVDQNWARGRLLLHTLKMFQGWNSTDAVPTSLRLPRGGFAGKLANRVGMMGHSRGGEGVRAALSLWRDQEDPWARSLRKLERPAVLEIAPVDGQTQDVIDAFDAPWGVILPLCDGDVRNLDGARVYDRAVNAQRTEDVYPKFTFTIHGADHNNINTEWADEPDGHGRCGGPNNPEITGTQERNVVGQAVNRFFRGTVGQEPEQLRLFNPVYPLPKRLTAVTQVDRSYTPGPSRKLVQHLHGRFETIGLTSLISGRMSELPPQVNLGAKNEFMAHVQTPHEGVMANSVNWEVFASLPQGLSIALQSSGRPKDLSAFKTLDLRLTRVGLPGVALNPLNATDAGLFLRDAEDRRSERVALSSLTTLNGPAGLRTGFDANGTTYTLLLQSVRVPLSKFRGADHDKAVALDLMFDRTRYGALVVSDVTLSRTL